MLPTVLSILLAVWSGGDDGARNEARLLLDTIEALQQPIEDFRCEFEGTMRFRGKILEYTKTGEDGIYDTFSAVFIWKRGGDTYTDGLHRREPGGTITRESLVVRVRERQAEEYHRLDDAPLGYAVIKDPNKANSWDPGCLGYIFLIDKLKRDVADEYLEPSVAVDQIEGRPYRVLNIALKDVPDSLIARYWIDLRRNGHVVRQESYMPGKVMAGRLDIKLSPFKVGSSEVWMPVSGESVGYAALENKKPVVTKEPTSINKIHVVDGTMVFNKHPGLEVFTMKYKPGTPVSDQLRKLTYEFGQQKIGAKPTKLEAEKMLHEQVAKANEQKAELVVATPSQGFDWTPWITWGLAGTVVVSSIALWLQRRGH
jgi:hypothetical protein